MGITFKSNGGNSPIGDNLGITQGKVGISMNEEETSEFYRKAYISSLASTVKAAQDSANGKILVPNRSRRGQLTRPPATGNIGKAEKKIPSIKPLPGQPMLPLADEE